MQVANQQSTPNLQSEIEKLKAELKQRDKDLMNTRLELHNHALRHSLITQNLDQAPLDFPVSEENLHPLIRNAVQFLPSLIPAASHSSFEAPKQLETGEIYYGQWKDGKRNGKGICIFRNWEYIFGKEDAKFEFIYEGEWLDDQFHGVGRWIEKGGRVKQGLWTHGEYSGWMLKLRNLGESNKI